MRSWHKTGSLLFLAVASVYPVSALSAGSEKQAGGKTPTTDVRLLDETAGPIASADPAPAKADDKTDGKGDDKANGKADIKADAPAAAPAKPATGTSATAPQVNVSDAGTVEIHVNEANLVEVLRMLSLQSQKNIVASKDVRGTVTANLYNVTIREALDAILKANGYGYREKGNFIYVYTAKELADIEKSERQTQMEVFHLHYSPAANVSAMLKPVLSTEGQVSFSAAAEKGIETGGKDAGGNSHAADDVIVVRDYPENLEKVKKIIKEVDKRPQQILVEATIVSARLTEDNAFGIDFTIVGGVDFTGIATAGVKTVEDFLSGKVLSTSLADKGVGGANTGFSQNVPTGGLRVGVATNNVAVFLSALDQVTHTTVLANPKVLTLNKQRGEVLVGREDGYLTTTVTESTSVQAVQFLQTGTRLIFRPYIGDDGYIRMEVHPEDSDGKVVGGLPQKTTTEVTTNVLVKDGHTIVIGGLFRESSLSNRGQIPGLGNLPIVGALFRSQQDQTTREEIVILLTPHIVKNDAAYSKASEEELKEMEKMRVGVRRGMMFFGRERLAECSYDAAVSEMNKPHPDTKKAIWHLNCATNLNPTFSEAIHMKESLTGKELSTVDNSTIRTFVTRQIMAERAAGTQGASAETQNQAVVVHAAEASASPATQPTAASATTQPALAEAPTTQPAQVAISPVTQPAQVAVPATQPVADAKDAQPEKSDKAELEKATVAAGEKSAPTTQPAAKSGESVKPVVVTELPQEPATPPIPDDNDD